MASDDGGGLGAELPPPTGLSIDQALHGTPIAPADRIRLYGHAEWEKFVEEWLHSLKSDYSRVERTGGAGDMGIDVRAVPNAEDSVWDNYQCKHYDHALYPSDIWIELAKLFVHAASGEFSLPRHYWFVAPHGAGPALANLMRSPEKLKEKLIANWDKSCRKKVYSGKDTPLTGTLRVLVLKTDFSMFGWVPPLHLIDGHAKTNWYVGRFGGGLPERPSVLPPPHAIEPTEAIYVRCLLDAYGDHLRSPLSSPQEIADPDIREHFSDSRYEFYSAESLRAFSRDTLPPESFRALQEDIHAGIKDSIRADYPDGYKRVMAVTSAARGLSLASHALSLRMTTRDAPGVCHQLANDGKLKWVRT